MASLGNGSLINVNGGNLILRNTSASTVFGMIQSGFNGGLWNTSSGISSTAAGSDPTHLHAIGMLQPSSTTTFESQSLGSNDVAVKYTYYGDSNLDGQVDGSDYSNIDNGYLQHLTGWQNGDFNYDGTIDGSDYTLIDNAYNRQGAQIASQIAATPTAQVLGNQVSSSVPEPASVAILGISALGLLGRHRRNRRAAC